MQNETPVVVFNEPVGEISKVRVLLKNGSREKKVTFPNYILELKAGQDIISILHHHETIPNDSPIIISLPFASDIKKKAISLDNLPMRLRPQITLDDFIKNHILIADPCPEAFWLKRPELRNKIKEIKDVPPGFCNTFDDFKSKSYTAWAKSASSGDFANFIDALIRYEVEYGFDYFVPLTPVVDSSTLSSPLYVNNYNVAVSMIMENSSKKLPILFNLTLNPNVFTDYKNEIMENIKSYITEEFRSDKKHFHGLYVRIRGIDKLIERKDYKKVKPLLLEFLAWLGSFSKSFQLPVFLVHSGYFGYYALEMGIQAFSEPTSGDLDDLKDIIKDKKQFPKKEKLFGKTLIIDDCRELSKEELDLYIRENGRLPKLEGVPDVPTDEQNLNPTKFRDHFSKPRRYATRKEEIMRLRVAMRNKELDCIEQYLSRCKNDSIKKFIELEVVKN